MAAEVPGLQLHGESGAKRAKVRNDWSVREYGGGVTILEKKLFGRLFIPAPASDYEDL